MNGTALATPDDFATYVGRPLANLDADRVDQYLGLASALVRDELGQMLERLDGDVMVVTPRAGAVLLLPELPVWSVTWVEQARTLNVWTGLVEGVDYTLELGRDGREGIVRSTSLHGWPRRWPLRITYDHGYTIPGGTGSSADTDLPDGLKLIVLKVAARGYSNPSGHAQETIGSYSYTDRADAAGLVLSTGDKDALGPYYPGNRSGRL